MPTGRSHGNRWPDKAHPRINLTGYPLSRPAGTPGAKTTSKREYGHKPVPILNDSAYGGTRERALPPTNETGTVEA